MRAPKSNKQSKETNDWVVVGRFGRVHGLKGFITIHSFTEPRDNILNYSGWHMNLKNQWQPIELLKIESNNKSITALIKGFEQRELASQLTNIDIAVKREALPELKSGEYYWHDLIGLKVINHKDEILGIITDIMPTGANDVLIVEGNQQHLIRYLPEKVVKMIDLEQQQIKVDWEAEY